MGIHYNLYVQNKKGDVWGEDGKDQLHLELGKAYNHSVTADEIAHRNGNRGTPRIIELTQEEALAILEELDSSWPQISNHTECWHVYTLGKTGPYRFLLTLT